MDGDALKRLVTTRTMTHLHRIIAIALVPTTYVKPPIMYGTKSAGSLTAAQWTSMIQLYVPLALGTLWHPASPLRDPDAAPHAATAFDNVMHLSQASLICYKNSMSDERASRFRDHYTNFIKTFTSEELACYGEKPVPNLHACFHIYDFLRDFGPCRVAHCLPFERLIGKLQAQNTNHKTGTLYLLPLISN